MSEPLSEEQIFKLVTKAMHPGTGKANWEKNETAEFMDKLKKSGLVIVERDALKGLVDWIDTATVLMQKMGRLDARIRLGLL
jgi:hypothetical protein